jgi:hypothetical protein
MKKKLCDLLSSVILFCWIRLKHWMKILTIKFLFNFPSHSLLKDPSVNDLLFTHSGCIKAGYLFTSCVTTGFLRRTLPCGVSKSFINSVSQLVSQSVSQSVS